MALWDISWLVLLKFVTVAHDQGQKHTVRNKTYTQAKNPGERIFVDTADPLLESLIGWCY